MRKIIEYIIVVHVDQKMLIKLVQDCINYGWQPLGGPVFMSGTVDERSGRTGSVMGQALVKYEEPRAMMGGLL